MKLFCMRGGDGMPRMSKKAKLEWDFFLNPNTGRKNYNLLCRRCLRECKQSYRTVILECPRFVSNSGRK